MKVIASVTCKCGKHDVMLSDVEQSALTSARTILYVRENFSHCEKCGKIYTKRVLRKE